MEMTSDQTKTMLTRLALGIVQQENDTKLHNQVPVSVLHPYIRQAWEYLTLCAYLYRLPLPSQITDFIYLLHQPVESWEILGEHCRTLGLSGSVLSDEGLSPQFRALAEQFKNTYKPHLELEDSFFREIFELCKQYDDAESYTSIRTFLLQNPIYDDIYLIENPNWQDVLAAKVERCYEPIPSACIRGNGENAYIVTCPHCGWALVWRRDGSAHCHEDGICQALYRPLADMENDANHRIAYQNDMVRTKEGVQRFVVSPEISLMQIYTTLQNEWNVRCELFPNLDSYDLLVALPNGDRWAVDVKDWSNAVSLAVGVSQNQFRYLPQWDKAFYVFPDYRANMAYLNEFKNYWTPQKDVTFLSQNEFLRRVREMTR